MTVEYNPRTAEWAREDRTSLAAVRDRLSALVDALAVPDGGFSVDPVTGHDVTDGYAVSIHPQDGSILGAVTPGAIIEYVVHHADARARPGAVFGGWRDPADGRIYLDVSTFVHDRTEALALGRAHDQLAIYDFAAGESIRTY
jgi:hypothetical protein